MAIDWKKYTLLTSNKQKLEEFHRFGLPVKCKKGKDLDEVDGSALEVIRQKSKESGAYTIVEDTSLEVQGADIGVNIRWLMKKLNEYEDNMATWTVLIGLNDGKFVKVYKGETKGYLRKCDDLKAVEKSGFDAYFVPIGSNKTLYELGTSKDKFSARKEAVDNMLRDKAEFKIAIDSIKEWRGEYQKKVASRIRAIVENMLK